MTSRPYASLGIGQLEDLAPLGRDDPALLRRLMEELQHRTTPRARQLRSQLEGLHGPAAGEASLRERKRDRPCPSPPATPISVQELSAGGTGKVLPAAAEEHESLLQKYEALRATFTVEAELLARWGMTASLPYELQELVFAEWAKRLRSGPDAAGRSMEALAGDRVRISRERNAFDRSEETRRGTPVRTGPSRSAFDGEIR